MVYTIPHYFDKTGLGKLETLTIVTQFPDIVDNSELHLFQMLNNITNKTTIVLQAAFRTDLTSRGDGFSNAQQNSVGIAPAVQTANQCWKDSNKNFTSDKTPLEATVQNKSQPIKPPVQYSECMYTCL